MDPHFLYLSSSWRWVVSFTLVTKDHKKPRTWTDSLDKRPKRKKVDILERWDGILWILFIWLRIGTIGGLLWTRWWTFGFHKMLGNFLSSCKIGGFSRRAQLHEWVSLCFKTSISSFLNENFKSHVFETTSFSESATENHTRRTRDWTRSQLWSVAVKDVCPLVCSKCKGKATDRIPASVTVWPREQ
jgi:hypothetical protein